MKRTFAVLFIILLAPLVHAAEPPKPQQGPTLVFATVDEGKRILMARDEFVRQMSPFDRAILMKTDKEVTEKDFLAFVGKNVLAWTDADKKKVTAALKGLLRPLAALDLPFPGKVLLIKSTGKEEFGAAYTRANAIILPKAHLNGPVVGLRRLICHEFFHILSRKNPKLRNKLYASIGFVKCDEVELPAGLKARRITNPDAPRNEHCIQVGIGGKKRWAIPITYSSTKTYDVERGGNLFAYAQFRFLVVEREAGSSAVKPVLEAQRPKLAHIFGVSGFFEQVGMNTLYVVHPEEILADNFDLLVLGGRVVPSPEIIEKMRKILKEHGKAKRAAPEKARTPRR